MPVHGNDDASVYVKWSTPAQAAAALKSFSRRTFDGRAVRVFYVSAARFDELRDGV